MEVTYLKALPLKPFFQFLTEDISFFTIAHYGLPNITLQIPQNSLSGRHLEGEAVPLSDELTEHKAVSQKASFQFLTEDIPFSPSPLWASKYHLANSTR